MPEQDYIQNFANTAGVTSPAQRITEVANAVRQTESLIAIVTDAATKLAYDSVSCPGHSRSIALTKLQEAVMWLESDLKRLASPLNAGPKVQGL